MYMVISRNFYQFEFGIILINIHYFCDIFSFFVQSSILCFDYEMRALDLRGQTFHHLLRIAVEAANTMLEITRELPKVFLVSANSAQTSLQKDFCRFYKIYFGFTFKRLVNFTSLPNRRYGLIRVTRAKILKINKRYGIKSVLISVTEINTIYLIHVAPNKRKLL